MSRAPYLEHLAEVCVLKVLHLYSIIGHVLHKACDSLSSTIALTNQMILHQDMTFDGEAILRAFTFSPTAVTTTIDMDIRPITSAASRMVGIPSSARSDKKITLMM